jgi:TPR repeat protein
MVQFDAAIADDPLYANAYYGKGMLLKMRHEDKQAAEYMQKSCELKNELACLIVKGHIER